MRLALAAHYGGGPAYWLDPELPEEIVSTATAMILERNERG